MMNFNYVEGNEELLEDIYPVIDKSFSNVKEIKKELEEKARWGSMRFVIADNGEESVAVGIATVNNQNTGHVEYLMLNELVLETSVETEIKDRLVRWLKWLRVKSITVEPVVVTYK